jgi:hypothetical protein
MAFFSLLCAMPEYCPAHLSAMAHYSCKKTLLDNPQAQQKKNLKSA